MPEAQEAGIILALRGERQVQAGMAETAMSVRGLRNSLIEANAEMDVTRHRSFLMNQALFTARRLIYATTLTVGGLATAVAYMGFKFDMTMENNMVAMTQFLGSTQAAQDELTKLYDIAATTPFEFSDIVDATRRFLAFGFSLQETNRYLRIIGDTAAAFGGGAEQVQRMVLVFGQMRAAGRVLGQDLLQLEQIGVPALQILQEQLGLTQDQMANIGRLHIPADIAIEALMRGLDQRFHGLSEKQAKTLQGRLSTLHDYAARLFGTLTLPFYNRIRDYAIPQLTVLANQMQVAAKSGGITGALGVVDQTYGTHLVRDFTAAGQAAMAFWHIVSHDLIPILVTLNDVFSPLHVLLISLATTLGFFAQHSLLTKIIMIGLIAEFIRFRAVLLILGGPGGKGGLLGMIVRSIGLKGGGGPGSILSRFTAWMNMVQLLRFASVRGFTNIRYAYMGMTKGIIQNSDGSIRSITRLQKAVLRLRGAFLSLELASLGWIGAAIAMIAIIGILYWKWKPFHDLVNETALFFWHNAAAMGAVLSMFIPFATAFGILQQKFHIFNTMLRISVDLLRALWRWAHRVADVFSKFHLPHFGSFHVPGIPRFHLPGLASGGVVTGAGAFMVGERGPEVAMLPAGSAVSPVSITNFPLTQVNQGGRSVERFQIFLDGKELVKSSVRKVGDKKARS